MRSVLAISLCLCVISSIASADTFGTGSNQFTIDFVPISGNASSANGTNISEFSPGHSSYKAFSDPANSYRMGKYEVANDQWTKFKAAYNGAVTGTPVSAYDHDPYFTGSSVPTNGVSWYEAAQFVNYLNTSKGYQAAYKFTGTIHTNSYTLATWVSADTGYNAGNPYRNSNAKYFLPTENEWVKAAYWNGTSLQTYATKAGDSLYQGNGSNGGWNYDYCTMQQPWAVGSGSQELNGTYDMMGNVAEWMESPYYTGDYLPGSYRGARGGSYDYGDDFGLASSSRSCDNPSDDEFFGRVGFRVASVPEPASAMLMILGAAWMAAKRKRSIS